MSISSIYASDISNGTITKLHEDGTRVVVATGLAGPAGMALDDLGNLLFVANSTSGTIEKFRPDGVRSVFASGLSRPMGLARDASGHLYVYSASPVAGGGTITKFGPGGNPSPFAAGLDSNNPYLAFDNTGSLHANTIRSVKKFAANGVATDVLTRLEFIYGIALDSANQLYVGLQNSGSILNLPYKGYVLPNDNAVFNPAGLGIDATSGCLYVAFGDSVRKYHLDGTGAVLAAGFGNTQYLAVYSPPAAPTGLRIVSP